MLITFYLRNDEKRFVFICIFDLFKKRFACWFFISKGKEAFSVYAV